ncbi:Trypsin [Oryctes borbonicus]|uniref:Trypsin n=1 Tax=Oryctes borbonicus TaxID=1629725 RepID=A0A0T6B3B7_9SCAR|nr:Trypsin [Oryctes borbonicus]
MVPQLNLFPFFHLLLASLLLCIVSQEQSYPKVNCPHIFKYAYELKYGGYHGLITIPKDASTTSEIQVNMSSNSQQHVYSNLQIRTISKMEDFFKKDGILQYVVIFPTHKVIPKLISLTFNGRVLCSGIPDPLTPGVVQTHMWAKSIVTTYGPIQSTQLQKPLEIFTVPSVPIQTISQASNDNQPATILYQFGVPFTSVASSNYPYQCGTSGANVPNGNWPFVEFPWLAAIMYKENANYKLQCTGNLISNKHVITAGHCVENTTIESPKTRDDFVVVLGKLNEPTGNNIRTTRSVKTNADSKIAIIILKEPVIFERKIRPICLWNSNEDQKEMVGKIGVAVGWDSHQGKRTPKKVELPIVAQEECLQSSKSPTFCAGKSLDIHPNIFERI